MKFLSTALMAAPAMAAWREIYQFDGIANLGGFSMAYDYPDARGSGTSDALLLTSYSFLDLGNLFDSVQVIRNFPERVADGRRAQREVVTYGTTWPRTADFLPADTISGVRSAFVTTSGFLLPLKNPGAIDLYTVAGNRATQYRLTPPEDAWWYTRKEMVDINGDGRMDILTGRAFSGFPPLPDTPYGGQMLWLEQPENPLTEKWTMHILADNAAGVAFRFVDLNGDGVPEITSCGYFEKKLYVYSCPTGDWTTCDSSNVQTTVVEENIGIVFDLNVVDANNDGKVDLVVTNNAIDNLGGAWAYEVPTDIINGKWVRHTLIDGLTIPDPQPGLGAPGSVYTWAPRSRRNMKPLVFVCGDDNGMLYQLTPKSEAPGNWEYTTDIIYKSVVPGVVHSVLNWLDFVDVNGDGQEEMMLALYHEKRGIVFEWVDEESSNKTSIA